MKKLFLIVVCLLSASNVSCGIEKKRANSIKSLCIQGLVQEMTEELTEIIHGENPLSFLDVCEIFGIPKHELQHIIKYHDIKSPFNTGEKIVDFAEFIVSKTPFAQEPCEPEIAQN